MKKKYIIQVSLFVLSILLTVTLSSMAIFIFAQEGTVENTITTGTISFTYTEDTNGIEIIEAMPITDAAGKMLQASNSSLGVVNGYFDFTVEGNIVGSGSINYDIFIKEDASNTLSSEHIKVYLTNPTTEEAYAGYTSDLPVVSELSDTVDDINVAAKSLYSGSMLPGSSTVKFRLRIWLDENYNDNILGQTYQLTVGVRATT